MVGDNQVLLKWSCQNYQKVHWRVLIYCIFHISFCAFSFRQYFSNTENRMMLSEFHAIIVSDDAVMQICWMLCTTRPYPKAVNDFSKLVMKGKNSEMKEGRHEKERKAMIKYLGICKVICPGKTFGLRSPTVHAIGWSLKIAVIARQLKYRSAVDLWSQSIVFFPLLALHNAVIQT